MALAHKPRTLSLDEAVEAVYAEALDGRSVAEAAAEYAHEIDDRDIFEAVRTGLIDLAHRRLARQRRAPAEEESGTEEAVEIEAAFGTASPPKAKPARVNADFWKWLDGNYEAADGTRKPVKDFGLEDALHLRAVSNNRADGLLRVRDAMDIAVAALRTHKAARIGDLPVADKRKIAEQLG